MRVQVNLASRPFVELRPFFLRLRLVMAALAVLGLGIAIWAHLLSAKAARQQLELDRLRNQTIAVQQAKLHTEQRMRDPVNARVLDRAHFLNALFLRKSFSWTAVMMDLENVLPNGVQVTSIEPQVSPDGNVVIRLRVAGERANAVQLVRNLERSHRFLQPRLAGEASQVKENANGQRIVPNPNQQGPAAPPGVEFDILADYNPLPPGESYTSGHGRVTPVSDTSPAVPVIRPARTPGINPAANLRRGYPADGVRLQPYSGSAPTNGRPQPATTQGGSR
jgi:type IV pilus assembly protein PilN